MNPPPGALHSFLQVGLTLHELYSQPDCQSIHFDIWTLVDALPLSWLVAVQFYRLLDFMFPVLWWDGRHAGSVSGPYLIL
jgi:hypothetical protein